MILILTCKCRCRRPPSAALIRTPLVPPPACVSLAGRWRCPCGAAPVAAVRPPGRLRLRAACVCLPGVCFYASPAPVPVFPCLSCLEQLRLAFFCRSSHPGRPGERTRRQQRARTYAGLFGTRGAEAEAATRRQIQMRAGSPGQILGTDLVLFLG